MSDREDYKIYVGNLSYDVSERQVRQHFGKYGDVDEVFIATDRIHRRPKGYCFVTFRDIDDAKEAIECANNTQFAGREINVHKALPKRSGSRYDDRRRRRSPSPRRRSRSPRRSLSPRRRSRSPRRRSGSPRRKSRSPRRLSTSPRRQSNSPRRRSPCSPRRQSNSPKRRSISPKRRSASPRRRSASDSPRRKSTSPS